MTVGQRKDIAIDIGNLTPMKNGVEVTVEEIGKDGSKYLIPLEHERNSNIYKGNILLKIFLSLPELILRNVIIAIFFRLLDSRKIRKNKDMRCFRRKPSLRISHRCWT